MCASDRARGTSAGSDGLMRRTNLSLAQCVAGAAAIGLVDEDVADLVPLEPNLPEDAHPLRLVLHVDQNRADSLLPDVGLELRDKLWGGVREILDLGGQVGAGVDGLVDVSACQPGVEVGVRLPEHACVTNPGHHDNDL